MYKKIYYAIILTVCCIITSCSSDTVYHHYLPIEKTGWEKGDTLYFILKDSINTGKYESYIGVRHTVSYKYKDLWVSICTNCSEKPDTVHLILANKDGKWNSNGTASGYYQYETKGSDLHFSNSNDSIIKIWHIMKDTSVKDITDVGIKLTEK